MDDQGAGPKCGRGEVSQQKGVGGRRGKTGENLMDLLGLLDDRARSADSKTAPYVALQSYNLQRFETKDPKGESRRDVPPRHFFLPESGAHESVPSRSASPPAQVSRLSSSPHFLPSSTPNATGRPLLFLRIDLLSSPKRRRPLAPLLLLCHRSPTSERSWDMGTLKIR